MESRFPWRKKITATFTGVGYRSNNLNYMLMTSTSGAKIVRKTYKGKRKQQKLTERSGILDDDSAGVAACDCGGYFHTEGFQGGLTRGNESVPISLANEYAPACVLGGVACVYSDAREPRHLSQFGKVSSESRGTCPKYGVFSCRNRGTSYNLVSDIPNGATSILQGVAKITPVDVEVPLHVVTGRRFA